jgi:predicted nucleotidyltransferase
MAQAADELAVIARRYAEELERLGVPVERIIAYGSWVRGIAGENSDIDLAVFSEAFGPPRHRETSGILSRAKRVVDPMIEAIGFHPSELQTVRPISFLQEIVSTGGIVYQRPQQQADRTTRQRSET